MDVLGKIRQVLDAQPNEAQLNDFLADVRDSIATSGKQFIRLQMLSMLALLSYHLVVHEGTTLSLFDLPLSSSALLQRVFLVVPAALLSAASAIGYLRRCQREVYDYLSISRFRALGQTGLHELRLPSDYILGLCYLRDQGDLAGKALSHLVASLSIVVFALGPVIYVVYESLENIRRFGAQDWLAIFASLVAILLSLASILIIVISSRIRA